MDTNILIIISFFIGGFAISLVVNTLLLRFSESLGIRNKNDIIVRWSSSSKPSLGGISLFFVFIAVILAIASIYPTQNIFLNIKFVGLIAASILAFGIGVMDDAYNTRPFLKLFGQISCGLVLVFTDNNIDFFHSFWLDSALTVFWIVAIMNSLNMLDNMDGITATVSLFILLTCLFCLLFSGNQNLFIWTLIILAQVGGIIGFLIFNINPSKMFMGDSGSQFIGLYVGYFGIKAIWNLPATLEIPSWISIFLILTAFTPTIADTLTVTINRKRKGSSVMVGGKDHTTHHLVYKGHSDFKVWVIFLIISCFSAIYAILLGWLAIRGYYYTSFLGLLFFLSVFIPLYRNTLKYPAPKND